MKQPVAGGVDGCSLHGSLLTDSVDLFRRPIAAAVGSLPGTAHPESAQALNTRARDLDTSTTGFRNWPCEGKTPASRNHLNPLSYNELRNSLEA